MTPSDEDLSEVSARKPLGDRDDDAEESRLLARVDEIADMTPADRAEMREKAQAIVSNAIRSGVSLGDDRSPAHNLRAKIERLRAALLALPGPVTASAIVQHLPIAFVEGFPARYLLHVEANRAIYLGAKVGAGDAEITLLSDPIREGDFDGAGNRIRAIDLTSPSAPDAETPPEPLE